MSSTPIHVTGSDALDDANLDSKVLAALATALAPIEPAPDSSGRVKSRLFARLKERAQPGPGFVTIPPSELDWQSMWPGIALKVLHDHGDGQSFMLRMEPGARLPRHAHATEELCVVLEGQVMLGDIEAGPGTYHLALAGSDHVELTTRTGCLLFLRADLDHGIRF